MARFDYYQPASGPGSGWLLDVQADVLDLFNTRVVVPLMPVEIAPKPARRLNPIFPIDGTEVVLATQFLSAVPLSLLKTRCGSLASRRDEVMAALDMLLIGF